MIFFYRGEGNFGPKPPNDFLTVFIVAYTVGVYGSRISATWPVRIKNVPKIATRPDQNEAVEGVPLEVRNYASGKKTLE